MCYYIIQNIIETIRHSFPGSTSKDLGGGASVLLLTLALPRVRSNARAPLCRAACLPGPCGVPRRGSIWKFTWPKAIARVLFPWLYPMQTCRATPENQRLPDSASLRSFAGQRYLARCVAPRDLGLLKPCSYSFLTQGHCM